MKCRLCGQPTVGNGKMCVDCVGALRRARKDFAAPDNRERGPQPPGDDATATIRVPVGPATSAPAIAPRPLVLWAAGCLLVTACVYYGGKLLDWQPAGVAAAEGSPVRSAASPLVEAPVATSAASAGIEAEATRPTAAPATPVTVPKVSAPPAIANARPKKSDSKTTRTVPAPDPATLALSDKPVKTIQRGSNDVQTQTASSQPPTKIAQATSASTGETADRASVLARDLKECAEVAFLSRFICEQRAWLQYCEGGWGTRPQCTRSQGEQR